MSARSGAEPTDFPYPTFDALEDAQAHGRALIWVRFDFGAAWALDRSGRFGNALLCGAGIWGALIFGALAWHGRDVRLLRGVVSCLIGAWRTSASPNCVSGGGCVANLMLAGGALAGFLAHAPALMSAGPAGWLCWVLTSAGLGTTDVLIRERMMRSEETFLWLLVRGAVVRVESAPPPDDARPGERVWPPPPQAP